MYKCIIVDDEHLAQKRLSRLLEKHSRSFRIAATFDNAQDLLHYLLENKADIIFLDIEMPGIKGIDALKQIPQDVFVLFTTAYKEYALDAFENDAFDYLLKPISQERFDKAILKIQSKWNKASQCPPIETSYATKNIRLIPVQLNNKTIFIKPEEISYCETKNKYVSLHTLESKSYLVSYTLNDLEKTFPHLIRIQKSVLVNKNEIKEIRKHLNARVIVYMNDKQTTDLVSGRAYAENIRNIITL